MPSGDRQVQQHSEPRFRLRKARYHFLGAFRISWDIEKDSASQKPWMDQLSGASPVTPPSARWPCGLTPSSKPRIATSGAAAGPLLESAGVDGPVLRLLLPRTQSAPDLRGPFRPHESLVVNEMRAVSFDSMPDNLPWDVVDVVLDDVVAEVIGDAEGRMPLIMPGALFDISGRNHFLPRRIQKNPVALPRQKLLNFHASVREPIRAGNPISIPARQPAVSITSQTHTLA